MQMRVYNSLRDSCLQAGQEVDYSCAVSSHQDSLKNRHRYLLQNSLIQIASSGTHLDLKYTET